MAEHRSTEGVTLSLAGKVALVTGGSRGIGAATVRLFRRAGARVVFSYRSAEEQARELVAECGGEDDTALIEEKAMAELAGEIADEVAALQILSAVPYDGQGAIVTDPSVASSLVSHSSNVGPSMRASPPGMSAPVGIFGSSACTSIPKPR